MLMRFVWRLKVFDDRAKCRTKEMKNQKLELTWIGKENRPRLEPRVLLEDPEKSYHAAQRVTDNDLFDNRLIFGNNLLALKVRLSVASFGRSLTLRQSPEQRCLCEVSWSL